MKSPVLEVGLRCLWLVDLESPDKEVPARAREGTVGAWVISSEWQGWADLKEMSVGYRVLRLRISRP